jgi:hypothetical protein
MSYELLALSRQLSVRIFRNRVWLAGGGPQWLKLPWKKQAAQSQR